MRSLREILSEKSKELSYYSGGRFSTFTTDEFKSMLMQNYELFVNVETGELGYKKKKGEDTFEAEERANSVMKADLPIAIYDSYTKEMTYLRSVQDLGAFISSIKSPKIEPRLQEIYENVFQRPAV